jgi:hypothetical protein
MANNLGDFIFSELLGASCSIETGRVAKQAQTLYAGYLKSEAIACLNSIYAREPQTYPFTKAGSKQAASVTGYISMQECRQYIEQINRFANFGQRFVYALPQPVIVETEENKRRVGTLRLFVQTDAPEALKAQLKQLNWRQEKTVSANRLCYIRKNYVIFGIPSMATLDSTFGPQLRQWVSQYSAIQIQFTQDNGATVSLA